MRFISSLSTKQYSYIFFLILGIFLLSVKPTEAFKTLKTISFFMIILSVIFFWEEASRRYKIISPYKENMYDSKAEEKIAGYFKRKNIIFNHHPELKVPKPFWIFTIPFINTRLEPDFFLPEFDVFVEYWGLIDNPKYKKEKYDFKKKLYTDNNLNLISLYPKNLSNLDFVFTSKLLNVIKEKEGNLRKYR